MLLFLSACASSPPAHTSIGSAFNIAGRLSLQQNKKNVSVRMTWRHTSDTDDLTFSSPLGPALAHLWATSQNARLETATGDVTQAANLSLLSEQTLGVPLPMNALPFWLKGRSSSPATDTRTRSNADQFNRLNRLLEDGWTVEYLNYASEAPDALPTLIRFHKDDIEGRLKIDDWNLADE